MSHPLAVVTGATGGIGRVMTLRLIAEGYYVLACGRNVAKLETLHDQAPLDQISTLAVDIRRCQEPLAQTLSTLGTPSLLVCAHGAAPVTAPMLGMDTNTFLGVLMPDVYGTWLACQTVGAAMVQAREGSIVLISSLHARMTYPARIPYAVAKSAVCGLARGMALEWGPLGIRTNAILPWQCDNHRSRQLIAEAKEHGEDLEEAYLRRSPTRRLVQPEDIADTVLWLARTRSINGVEIVMDGGVTSSMWFKPYLESPHASPSLPEP